MFRVLGSRPDKNFSGFAWILIRVGRVVPLLLLCYSSSSSSAAAADVAAAAVCN